MGILLAHYYVALAECELYPESAGLAEEQIFNQMDSAHSNLYPKTAIRYSVSCEMRRVYNVTSEL